MFHVIDVVHEQFSQCHLLPAINAATRSLSQIWKFPQSRRGDPERIMLWPQVITGLEVDELTAVRVLDPTWRQRRQRLQELGGPPDY